MMTSQIKPLLVSGSHRSGTTWIGQMINAAPEYMYVNEPFKLKYRPGICGVEFPYWFMYITEQNAGPYFSAMKRTISLRYNLWLQLRHCHTLHQMRYTIKSWLKWTLNRITGKSVLLKDPIAIFSAEWLSLTFDMNVLLLIRHPAAFASSLKRYNHTFPFAHFLEQSQLMEDHLSFYTDQIEAFKNNPPDIIDQAILLWNCIYTTIAQYQSVHPDWLFVRHEDISRDPIKSFGQLYASLGLVYSEEVKETINQFSNAGNPTEIPDDESHHYFRLDSRANIKSWTSRLNRDEIARIRVGTHRVSEKFYDTSDW